MHQDESILQRTVKLVYRLGLFRFWVCTDESTASSFSPDGFMWESSEGHHLLDSIGTDMRSELLEVRVFMIGEVFLLAEEEWDHQDLIVLLLEQLTLTPTDTTLLCTALLQVVVSTDHL